jgi:TetR/AcrR family transcriptional regulator, regulator of cefoperazone and chloramphenicol sensitivity
MMSPPTDTRSRLLRAAEQLFAQEGIERAQMRAITRLAGQRNESALHYHFGSRADLLRAVLHRHLGELEQLRSGYVRELVEQKQTHNLRALVNAVVLPTGAKLAAADGQDYLLIMVQCLGHIGRQSLPEEVPPSLVQLIGWIRAALAPLPEAIVEERINFALTALFSALAERVRAMRRHDRLELGQEAFLNNLAAMLCGALAAA